MEERIRCDVCHEKLTQIGKTNQYYCQQSPSNCYASQGGYQMIFDEVLLDDIDDELTRGIEPV